METWTTTTEADDRNTYPECDDMLVEAGTTVTIHYTWHHDETGGLSLDNVSAYDPENYEVEICDATAERLIEHLTEDLAMAREETAHRQHASAYLLH